MVVPAASIFRPVPSTESIVSEAFDEFNFHEEPGLLQFWECIMLSGTEDIGCDLILTDTYIYTRDHEGLLQDYRRRCLENDYPFVGVETRVGNWLPGRAAQTKIADHWTIHYVLDQEDRHSADVGGKGQLVLPVFCDQGAAGSKLVGIIELVTLVPKESYVEDFEQIHNLLKDVGLNSTYMGKTIKVEYDDDLIKFTLPLSAKLTDLHKEVIKRFLKLKPQNLRVEHKDTEGNRLPISSDEELHACMAESSSRGAKFIRMRIMLNT
ncbi:putative PB1 domain-containing protein [Helianthus debilis subsp. tardiflorus]